MPSGPSELVASAARDGLGRFAINMDARDRFAGARLRAVVLVAIGNDGNTGHRGHSVT